MDANDTTSKFVKNKIAPMALLYFLQISRGRADLIKFERELTPLVDIVYDIWASGKLSDVISVDSDNNCDVTEAKNAKGGSYYTY